MKLSNLYYIIEVVLTVILLWLGDRFGVSNIWLVTGAVIAHNFIVEILFVVREKEIGDNKKKPRMIRGHVDKEIDN